MIEKIINDSRNGTRPKVAAENLKLNEQSTNNVEIVDEIPNNNLSEVSQKAPTLPESEPINSAVAAENKPEKVLAKGRIALFLLMLLVVGGLGFLVWQRAIAPKPEKASRRGGKMQVTPVMVAAVTKKNCADSITGDRQRAIWCYCFCYRTS